MSTEQYTVEAFLEYVKKSRSKNTLKMYRNGLKKFSEWYGKTLNEILKERVNDWISRDVFRKKRFARKLEEFHAHLIKDGYSPNSATYYTQGLRALFAFYEMSVKTSNDISKITPTTRDYVPRVDQYARMYKVADNLRDKLITAMGSSLAWRIGDVLTIKKSDIPNLEQPTPIPFEKLTEKEGTIAKTFLTVEVAELLRDYLPTLPKDNEYLFPSGEGKGDGNGHLTPTTVNRMLKALAQKANIPIPKGKRLRFHCFRKRFMSEAANLRIDLNIAKLLVGKSVESSMLTYLSEVDLKSAFLKISQRLRLTEKKTPIAATQDISDLQHQIDELKKMIHFLAARHGTEIIEDAAKELGMQPQDVWKHGIPEVVKMLIDKQWKKQAKEYERMQLENNNNH